MKEEDYESDTDQYGKGNRPKSSTPVCGECHTAPNICPDGGDADALTALRVPQDGGGVIVKNPLDDR